VNSIDLFSHIGLLGARVGRSPKLGNGRSSYKYGNTINYFALNGIREF
jgi:hypothetical protein